MIDLVTLFAVVSDDSLRGAVAATALVVARRCLAVALACWNGVKYTISKAIIHNESKVFLVLEELRVK